MSDDLIKRLRSGPISIPLADEAAARIEALEAENKRLREALEPFAKEAARYDPPEDDDHLHAWDSTFETGDLRRAAAALEKK